MGTPAQEKPPSVFYFGEFELDEAKGELWRDGTPVPIRRKPFQLLCYFLHNRGRTVEARELLSTVWPDTTVSPWALSTALHDLRKALSDHDPAHPIIGTLRCRGYRMQVQVAHRPVEPVAPGQAPSTGLSRQAPADPSVAQLVRDRISLKLPQLSEEELLALASIAGVPVGASPDTTMAGSSRTDSND